MRVMAIDYGDARTGFAVSDPSATLTGDAWVLHEKSQAAVAEIAISEANARDVGVIVVGYPKNMDGTLGLRAEKSEKLAALLRAQCGLEVVLWDERMTTISASRVLTDTGSFGKKRKKTIDAVAASIILDSFLRSRAP